ncbi:hypothetical protein SAMN02745866_01569 [Alteromonadaceae bacterium Bs31]|nr:hypothetical protein SAMN02745866_01569 [Alteromonadaceae bacterium Bs31]
MYRAIAEHERVSHALRRCSCELKDWYILPESHKYVEENCSMLMAAKMVSTHVTICTVLTNCVERFPRINYMNS